MWNWCSDHQLLVRYLKEEWIRHMHTYTVAKVRPVRPLYMQQCATECRFGVLSGCCVYVCEIPKIHIFQSMDIYRSLRRAYLQPLWKPYCMHVFFSLDLFTAFTTIRYGPKVKSLRRQQRLFCLHFPSSFILFLPSWILIHARSTLIEPMEQARAKERPALGTQALNETGPNESNWMWKKCDKRVILWVNSSGGIVMEINRDEFLHISFWWETMEKLWYSGDDLEYPRRSSECAQLRRECVWSEWN